MMGRILGRMLWREYQMARAFWLSVLLLTFAIQLCFLPIIKWYGGNTRMLAFTAIVMPLVYLLGICGTIFNREHENQTFGWLEVSTVRPSQVWLSKIGFALPSALIMLAILLIMLPVTSWITQFALKPIARDVDTLVRVWGVSFLLIAGLGIVCSQWIKQPMAATFAAGALFACVWMLLRLDDFKAVGEELIYGAFAGCILIAVSYLATPMWLHDSPRIAGAKVGRQGLRKRRPGDTAFGVAAGRRRRIGARVLWTIRRRQWMLWLLPIVLPTLLIALAELTNRRFASGPTGDDLVYAWAAFVAVLAPIVVGGTLFEAESSHTHRQFLVERGASGREIWWLRMLTMIAYAVPLGGILVLVVLLSLPGRHATHDQVVTRMIPYYLMYATLTFAVAQYFSLCIRSQLIAVFVTILGAATIGYWISIAWDYQIAALVVVLPALGFLIGAWWRAPDWLTSDTRLKPWLAPIAAPMIGLAVTYGALYADRVWTIPRARPGYDVNAFREEARKKFRPADANLIDSAAARASTLMHAEIMSYYASDADRVVREIEDSGSLVPTSDMPRIWNSDPSKSLSEGWEELLVVLTPQLADTIRTAHGLTNSTVSSLATDRNTPVLYSNFRETSHLILAYSALARWHSHHGRAEKAAETFRTALTLCQQMRRNGHSTDWLAAAEAERMLLENLVLWAASGKATPEAIRDTLAWMDDYWEADPEWSTFVKFDHLQARRFIAQFDASLDKYQLGLHPVQLLMPGERQRLTRIADWGVQQEVLDWIALTEPYGRQGISAVPHYPILRDEIFFLELITDNDLANVVIQHPSMVDGVLQRLVQLEIARTATELRLSLLAARVEHGALPAAWGDSRIPPTLMTNTGSTRSGAYQSFAYRYLPEDVTRAVSIAIFPHRYAVKIQGWVIEHEGQVFPFWQ